tara:strand:+ start:463 stop:615 length:153 start_codon:yes stop_codon:yes gene_type:complete
MATIVVSKGVHRRWKIYCAKRAVSIFDATNIALSLAMKKEKVLRGGKNGV